MLYDNFAERAATKVAATNMLYDNHGRIINYLRLAVTDRCNLRCFYCMPEEGIAFAPRREILTYEEMERIVRVLAGYGIDKVRITGGEPFVRRGLMGFLEEIAAIDEIKKIALTTNGVLAAPYVPEFRRLKIDSVNLSLDSLDPERFFEVTRRREFDAVMRTLDALLAHGIDVKINTVVMQGRNESDLVALAGLTRDLPVGVRFIEEMPFNGSGAHYREWTWNHRRIVEHLREAYPSLTKIDDPPHSTSSNYAIEGHRGTVGVIAAFSRTFCGTCNRIRITPQGLLKTCLYDAGIFNVRDLLRAGATDAELAGALLAAIGHRAKDGYEAEANRFLHPVSESMATIGG
jgi:molybdenum cofactor biosynthesis protein A